jgi:mono/diheme cytochrome c family protein
MAQSVKDQWHHSQGRGYNSGLCAQPFLFRPHSRGPEPPLSLARAPLSCDIRPFMSWSRPPASLHTIARCTRLIVAFSIVGLSSAAAARAAALSNTAAEFAKFRPFFEQHCFKCHSGEKPKGDWRIDELTPDFAEKTSRERWEGVLEKLEDGTMPPKAKPRPPAAEVHALTEWITAHTAVADAAPRSGEGRVVLRRLNRTEYENSVRDLLGVDTKLRELLPLDSSADGFDNVGHALHTSSFLLDQYLVAADTALNQAIVNKPQPPSTTKRHSLTEAHQVKSTKEKVFRIGDDGRVVMFSSSAWQAASLSPFYPGERGQYRFRMSVSAVQSAGKPVTFSVMSGGGGMGGPKAHLVSYFDAPPDKPKVFEFIDLMEPRTTITLLPYGLASAQSVSKVGADDWTEPGLAVDWLEVEGPLNETWPPESHRRIFGDLPQEKAPIYNQSTRVEVVSGAPAADADRILRAFARRAFRRSVTDADVAPYTALVAARLKGNATFEQAIRVGLEAILTAPEFLFLREKPGRLDDFALASRLSYFLWSSTPDEELLALAEKGKLSQPETLRAQAERMLASSKSVGLRENFLSQWLGLREIDATNPSQILYPDFDDMLKASMLREAELFFTEVLEKNLSLTNFVASDFTMLNGRLAKLYGIPDVDGWDFRKVTLPPGSHRGGFLTMACVLKVTANGTATSPVTRGAWVLDRILGTPPPRPPENVAQLIPDIRGATTIRDQLAKHRQLESCAGCHVKIDPPGFALESFDVIGGWRDFYRTQGNGKPVVLDGVKMRYLQGRPVDPADALADGRKFENIDEFKQLLLEEKDQITRALTVKLLTYATGAAPEKSDRSKVNAIVAEARTQDYGFRSLIHDIVQSELFRTK